MSLRHALRWFSLHRWENYCLLAMASVAFLIVTVVRTEARGAPATETRERSAALQAISRAKSAGWLERHALIKHRAAAHGHNLDVLLLGDSITHGWEFHDEWQRSFPNLSVVNAGISSDRVEHILWRVKDGLLTKAKPKVVILLAGINNLALHSPEAIAATQAETIRVICAHSPRTKILLLGVFPSGAEPHHSRRAKIERLNENLRRLADHRNVLYLDIGSRFLSADGRLSKEIMFDYLHLTRRGYRIWSGAMTPTLRHLL